MGPASSWGGYGDDGVVGFQVETMDETVGEVVSSFRPQAPAGRFDKEYDMAGIDDIGQYDKENGQGCQVVTMVECVGEFDFFSSVTCFLMKKMKNNVIVGNTGHIDKEIDVVH